MQETNSNPVTRQPIGTHIAAHCARRPKAVVLEGRFGRIEKLDALAHADDLWNALKDSAELWTYMAYGPFLNEDLFKTWIVQRAALNDPYYYAIINSQGKAVGVAALMEIRPEMRVIEIGHIIYGASLQRTSLATEAQYLLGQYVFETLGYRRYEWKCDALNAVSRRAAKRLGFTYEGLFRSHMIIKGRSRDTTWYSMLEDEWPMRKRAFEKWLAPANYDNKGRQKARL